MRRREPDRPIRRVRQALEGTLSPSLTSAVLFEALGTHGRDVPQSMDDLRDLVRGALAKVLKRRLGPDRAASLIDQVEEALTRPASARDSEPVPEEPDLEENLQTDRFARVRDADVTATVPTARRPVSVLIVSSGRGFESRMAVALGPRRVAPRSTCDPREIYTEPLASVVLIDAADFAAIEAADLATAFKRLPAETTKVLWEADLPYGRTVQAALEHAGVSFVTFDRKEGIDPLLDLIRSRRAAD